jgi:Protein of unknown function (DUF3071)
MRALRVVGLTEDGEVVLEDPVRLERFRVPADERLRAAARGDLSRLGQIAIELESQLRPREIQARIRAGASVEQVAAAAGVPEQKIERFAYPVLLERFRTAEIAQRAHPVRADGPDNRTLAEVIAHTFGLRGQAYEGARWDSWKGEDGRWVVALSWRAGRSDNRAHWTFQPGAHGGTVTALDEHASDLVEGLPARPLRTVGAVVDMNRPEEEPPPAPSPTEQWRAAASDSYRDPGRPVAERNPARGTPAEPWRPAPPVQRQAEPPAGAYRGAEGRPAAEPRDGGTRVAAEGAPGDRGPAPHRSAPPVRSEAARAEPARTEPARTEPARTEPVLREPDRARVEVRSGARAAEAGELPRPLDGAPPPRAAETAPPRAAETPSPRAAETPPPRAAEAPSPRAAEAPPPRAGEAVAGPGPETVAAPAPAPARAADPAVPATAARVGNAAAVAPRAPVEAGEAAEIAARIAGAAAAPAAGPARADDTVPTVAEPPTRAADLATPTSETADLTDHAEEDGGSASAAPAAVPAPTAAAPSTVATTPDTTAPAGDRVDTPRAGAPTSEPDARGAAAPEPPAAETPPASRRTKKGKPVMPSWDEVLLGVRGPR